MVYYISTKAAFVSIAEVCWDDKVDLLQTPILSQQHADSLHGPSVQMSLFRDLCHVQLWKILRSPIHVLLVGVFLWPPHVDRSMDVQLPNPRPGCRTYGKEEAKETLPSAAAGETEPVLAPEEPGGLVEDLSARA